MTRIRATRIARLEARGSVSRYPCRLVTPGKPVTLRDRQRFADRFRASQLTLIAAARSQRLAIVAELPIETPVLAREVRREPPTLSQAKPTFSASHKIAFAQFARLAGFSQRIEG